VPSLVADHRLVVLNLIVGVSSWGTLEPFQQAAQQAKRTMMILCVASLILEVAGGTALGIASAIGPNSFRRLLLLTSAFSGLTVATAVLVAVIGWPSAVPTFIWFLVGAVVAGSLFAFRLQRAPAKKGLAVLWLG